ncbi:GNAT family N-acetyltransferase [Algibacter mikhailovii]|uniref:GNAT family N-acetyltransferase n=1 Tax=Algibacter mikhailovii TaxID=425498 RepID=UPI002494D0B7|nr:GNAT family N-acetyltransferase [Algibacter mikhailovii]
MIQDNKSLYTIKTSNYNIKLINSEETHAVRHPILRAGQPKKSCIFEGDNLETSVHLGIYIHDEIIGVCSFFKNYNKNILIANQYQLRGMAILKNFQGKGLGSKMLNYGEKLLKGKQTEIIWCNARENALGFYKQLDYNTIGAPFDIASIGIHYIMFKNL